MDLLSTDGFFVVQRLFTGRQLADIQTAYDEAFSAARPPDIREGSTSVRFGGLIDRSPLFVDVFTHDIVLKAAERLIGPDYVLSGFHGRTLKPNAHRQDLHQDFPRLADGWPMLGFILMVDDFMALNGATRLIAGSQGLSASPLETASRDAVGRAGSIIIYNGSVWHGNGANKTLQPRRSVQGALIRADQMPATDHHACTDRVVAAQLSSVARRLLRLVE